MKRNRIILLTTLAAFLLSCIFPTDGSASCSSPVRRNQEDKSSILTPTTKNDTLVKGKNSKGISLLESLEASKSAPEKDDSKEASMLESLEESKPASVKTDTLDKQDQTSSIVVGNDLVKIEDNDSSFNLKVGNRGLTVDESDNKPKFHFDRYIYHDDSNWDEDESDGHRFRRAGRFRGHWTGVELGFNGYVTSDKSFSMPDNINYMTLQTNKSINFAINFTQLSIGLTRHMGFVTGLGISWNNYRFDGENNILKGTDGVIEELNPGADLKKSKLATVYLNVPLLFEVQIPLDNNRLCLGVGPMGALKLGSHTKMVYESGQTVKSYGDFSLNILRCGLTSSVGYGNFHLYGTYYLTPLFQKGKGPGGYDLYPFEIGVALTFND